MAITLNETDEGRILEARVSGKLTHADYEQFSPRFDTLQRLHGKLRVLFEMVDFHGWDAAGVWDDLKFDVKHFSDIERIAMVGDKAWEKGMSVFCRPFTTAKVRYFNLADVAAARAWLHET